MKHRVAIASVIFAASLRADVTAVTFDRDIAPVVFTKCAGCHRPGQVAPFPLLTYEDARKRAKQIADVTGHRLMPPWLPDSPEGQFIGDRRLSEEQIQMFADWLREGTPEGSAADLPKTPVWSEDWQLGKPDLVVRMPKKFVLAAEGRDIYRNFLIPTPLAEARYVRAVEFRPENRRVVHHLALAVDSAGTARQLEGVDGQPGFGEMIPPEGVIRPGGSFFNWTPGTVAFFDPPGFGWTLEPRQDLVVQAHLKTAGKPEDLQMQIGLYFSNVRPTNRTYVITLASNQIEIPPGQSNFVTEDRFRLPVAADLLALLPHAHYLGRKLEVFSETPAGQSVPLIRIPDWNFDWQQEFRLKTPVHLAAGTILHLRYEYDNSDANPRNPSRPPRAVRYGPRAVDEMCDCRLQLQVRRNQEMERLVNLSNQHAAEVAVAGDEYRLKINPHDSKARANIGLDKLFHGQLEDAAAQLRLAVKDDPQNEIAHYYLGLVYRKAQRYAEAREEFEAAVRINPRDSKAQTNLGLTFAELGDGKKAEGCFVEALRWNPGDALATEALTELRQYNAQKQGR